jgi:hypothetical protein
MTIAMASPLFAISMEIVKTSWVYDWIFILEAMLALAVLYLTFHALFLRISKTAKSPKHIQNAIPILKWITAFAALLALLGGMVDGYLEMIDLYMRGNYNPELVMGPVFQFLGLFIFGMIVACAAMLAIAIIYYIQILNPRRI